MPWEGLHPSSFWQLDFMKGQNHRLFRKFFQPVVDDNFSARQVLLPQVSNVSKHSGFLGLFWPPGNPSNGPCPIYHRTSTASWLPSFLQAGQRAKVLLAALRNGVEREDLWPTVLSITGHPGWCGWGQGSQVILEVGSLFHWCLFFQKHLPRNSTHIRSIKLRSLLIIFWYFLFGQTRTTPPHFTLKASLVQVSPH